MIVVRLFEGLGNQLFQYAMGRSLAERYGVPLRLDVEWFAGDQAGEKRGAPRRNFGLDAFCIEAKRASARDFAFCFGSKSLLPRIRGKLLRGGAELSMHVLDNFRRFNRGALVAGPNVYLNGYWQSSKYFEQIASALRRELTLRDSPAVRHAIDAEREFRLVGKPLVSVHVRRGDLVPYLRNGKLTRNYGPPTSVEYIRAAMQQFREPVRFVIVADPTDRQWSRQNCIGDDVVYYDGVDAFSDFEMMRRCDHHIIANSTFSWWSAWLGDNSNSRVIAPDNWFWPDDAFGRTSADLVPESWSVLPVNSDPWESLGGNAPETVAAQ